MGVLGEAHSLKQHEVSNCRQAVLQQRHPEGQGQQRQHMPGSTLWGGGDKQVSTQNCLEFSIIHECVVFVMQPDGAESVASLYSSDTASDKRAASHHTHNSGPPTISVSRASESSGTDRHLRLHFVLCDFIKQLLASLTKTADVFKAPLTITLLNN